MSVSDDLELKWIYKTAKIDKPNLCSDKLCSMEASGVYSIIRLKLQKHRRIQSSVRLLKPKLLKLVMFTLLTSKKLDHYIFN